MALRGGASDSIRSAKTAHQPPNSPMRGFEQVAAHSKPIGPLAKVSRQQP
jgi:hypothetical protein